MGLSAVGANARDAGRRAKGRFAAIPSGRRTFIGLGAVLVVILLVVAAGAWLVLRDPKTDTDAYRGYLVDTGGQDLPAEWFSGWSGEPRSEQPQIAEPDPAVVEVKPEQCAPGGELHQAAQSVSMNWAEHWSGQTLRLLSHNAAMDIDIADPKPQSLSQIDAWTSACPRTTFTIGDVNHIQKVQVLPVAADFWDMEDNRVYVVTINRVRGDQNLGTTTTLYAVSRVRHLTMQGALTIRGSVSDTAINTLNLLWERQTMKVRNELEA